MRALIRFIFFPVRVAARLLGFSLKLGYRVGTMPFRVTARTGRALGLKGLVLFVVGVAAGLLLAPSSGRELRQRVERLLNGTQQLSDDELAEQVRFELSHAPKTWHLPQPDVAVVAGRVELSGTVPHDTGREELERVAAAVPGITGVDNRLTVEAAGEVDDPSEAAETADAEHGSGNGDGAATSSGSS